jgi:uncharacterized protein YndB with AHSA1/START domain
VRYIAFALGGLAGIILIIAIVGWSLPVRHSVSREVSLAATPDRVYALISDPRAFPSWRSDVDSVDLLEPVGGTRRFREYGKNGPILFEVEKEEPGRTLITRIADDKLPFGGTWTYDVLPAADRRTTLRIREDGEVYNPIFRFMSRFVMGQASTIEAYLESVRRKLGSIPRGG